MIVVASPTQRKGGFATSDYQDEDGEKYVPSERAAQLWDIIMT